MTKRTGDRLIRSLSEVLSFAAIVVLLFAALLVMDAPAKEGTQEEAEFVTMEELEAARPGRAGLPEPIEIGTVSIEEAIADRRSIREFKDRPLLLGELSQLLWAGQGITDERANRRSAPSAGAKYPIELFVVVGDVENLLPAVYHYDPVAHALVPVRMGDFREMLSFEALSQEWVKSAPAVIVITGVYERTMEKYGERGVRYVHIEVGAVAENIYLEAESLDLGTTFVGAFSDEGVAQVLGADDGAPLGIMPVGAKRTE
jgi:SagB-type dehydrogenase family enzyme